MTNYLLVGDPLNPSVSDIIVQSDTLNTGLPVPTGWRVMTGNETLSIIMRVAYRYEINEED